MATDRPADPYADHAPPPRRPAGGAERFSLSQARSIVGDHFRPNPAIYWADFLASWGVAMAAFELVHRQSISLGGWTQEVGWPARLAAFAVSCLMIYRCALFIHELQHLPENRFGLFRRVWNLLCGVPFLIPSFVYATHVDHHRRKHYGTPADGEYLPLSSRPAWWIVGYLAQSLVIPVLAVVRFGVLTPLTWFHSPLRDWVLRHASSMIINPAYLRPLPTAKALRQIRWQEAWTCGFVWLSAVLLYRGAFHNGVVSPWVLPQAYLTGVTIVTLNALRTVVAHRWVNADEREMTFVEQMLDSVNYPPGRGSLAWLWAPLGLRYHALHHVFPSMPYHAMGEAHRRLMAGLPADSPYRRCNAESMGAELRALWGRARASERPKLTVSAEQGPPQGRLSSVA